MTDLDLRGGIRSRLTTGSSDTSKLNWWGKRWIELLRPVVDHSHYTRGKSCAKKGNVFSLDIKPGIVSALVESNRPTPYIVRFGFNVLSPQANELLMSRLREKAIYAAELLAGRLPSNMEELFLEAETRLFPNETRMRTFKCTCPSSDTICEHIVAVYMLLGEAFSNDPFLLLKLYGIDKNKLIKNLSCECNKNFAEAENADDEFNETVLNKGDSDDILLGREKEDDLKHWFGKAKFKTSEPKELKMPEAYSVMREFPFWRGVNPFLDTVKEYYTKAADFSYELLTGERRITVGRPKKS